MKAKNQNTIRILLLGTLIFGMGAFLLSSKPVLAAAGINKQINFQGKVVNTDGTNVSTASYTFLFCLYTTASPATACTSGADNDAVWRESKSVTVTDGIFQTNLGDTTALPGSVDFNTDNIYLGVNFNANGQMTPLVRFTAAPYAMNADKVGGLGTSDLIVKAATANQTVTSTQTSGTVFGITDTTAISAETKGLSITLSGSGAFDQTGLEFNLSGASGTNLNDIVGSGSTWKVSKGGAATLSSVTSSGAIAANGGITFDQASDTIGSFTASGTILMNSNILQDIGNTGTDFIASTGALTLAGVLTANGGISLAGSQSLSAAALSYVDLGLITHSTTANQGLRLPNAASATPSNPSSGEGYLAWDAAGNQLITYNGAAWTTVGGGSGANTALSNLASVAINTDLIGAVAGGMGIRGGSAANDDLILEGTTNATRTTSYLILQPNGGNVGIGTATPASMLDIFGTANMLRLSYDASNYATLASDSTGNLVVNNSSAAQNIVLIGDGSATDSSVQFDGNVNDYYVGQDDTDDFMHIGTGSVVGTNAYITLDSTGKVGIGDATPSFALDVNGDVQIQGGELYITGVTSSASATEGTVYYDNDDDNLYVYANGGWVDLTVQGGGSQTPWTSDIDADGYDLNDLSNILFRETTGAPIGTDVGFYRDNTGDLTGNVLTGKTFNLAVNGTDEYNFSSSALAMNSNDITGAGNITPSTNDTYDLGSDALRFKDLYLGGDTLHIGTSTTDEGTISYDTTGNIFNFRTDATTNADIAFFTDDLYLDKSTSYVGIGYSSPAARLDITGDVTTASLGSEMVTSSTDRDFTGSIGNWTAGSNWAYGTNNASHTAGTTGTLSLGNGFVDPDPVSGNLYQITFTINTTTAGTLTPSFGSANGIVVGKQVNTEIQTMVVTATGTGALTFTPNSAWAGTIDNVSVKRITPSNATQIVRNSNNTIGLEIRSGGTGLNNTFIGMDSGKSNTTGYQNSAMGNLALFSNTTGYRNSAMGRGALESNTTGGDNSAMGTWALYSNTTGINNSAMGTSALYSNTIGSANSAIGYQTLFSNTTGSYNTALGNLALLNNTTGFYNTASGYQILINNTTGSFNSAMGSYALYYNTTGNSNSASGYYTLYRNQTGNNNTAVGQEAGYGVASNSFSNDSLFGYRSGYALTTGSNNILLGYQAGDNLTSGANNIILGYDIDATTATTSNFLSIGNLIFGTGIDGTGTTVSTGNIGIGDTSPDQRLEILSSGAANTQLSIGNTNAGDYDSQIGFELADGTNTFTMGVDDSDSDKFKISTTALGTNDRLVIDSSGNVSLNGATTITGTITAGSGAEVITLSTGKIDADAISLITTGTDGLNTTSSATGLATYTDRLSLLQGCADGQVLKWVESTDVWNCADDSTGGGGAADTAKFTDSTPAAMVDNNTTEIFNDATAPNITPDSTSNTVLINVSVRTDGNSTSDSINHYRLVREDDGGSTNPACDGTDLQVGVFSSSFTTNTAEFNYATGTFLDAPASTAAVYYTVCSSADSSTTLQLHTAVTVILVELGADLAENYYTSDESIEPGDVVAIEGNLPAGVKKSGRSYDPSVIGVVSTAPGITLDDAIGLNHGRAVPVALAGRIPVKVSTENGRVAAGDYLTSSSVPGVAMKATKAGIVIGQALESFNYANDTVGRVMTFVKNTYFDGMRTVDAEGVMLSGAALLQKMLTEKNQAVTILDISEIATDRLSAGLEIITPKVTTQELATDVITSSLTNTLAIQFGTDGSVTFGEEGKEPTSRIDAFGNATFAGTVTAKSIRAESIEGLEIFTNQISSMEDKYAGLVALAVETTVSEATEESTSTATLPMDVVFRSLAVDRVNVNFDADILGKLSALGGLVIGGKAEFHGDTLFRKLASFFDGAIFKGSVMFEKTPTFNSDMAGFAVVTEGDRSVEVIFDEEYAHQPIVTVTLTSDVSPLYGDVSGRDMLADIEAVEKDFVDAYFENDIRYIVTKKGMRSFTIVLNKKAPRDLQFSWVAIAVKDSKTSLSQEVKEDSSETEDSSVIMDIAQSVSEPESLSEEGGVPQLFEPVVVVESEPESEAVSMPLSEETETVVENPQSDAVSVPAVQSDLSTGDVF